MEVCLSKSRLEALFIVAETPLYFNSGNTDWRATNDGKDRLADVWRENNQAIQRERGELRCKPNGNANGNGNGYRCITLELTQAGG
jgi:hypothetical protein